jgi:hypothetical protein
MISFSVGMRPSAEYGYMAALMPDHDSFFG